METSTTIKDLFGNLDYRFEIPNYQRAYAWEKKHRKQFIDDLDECDVKYYLGHFLFEQEGNTFYVIDGQQRLTTCVIFFSAAKNALEQRSGEWEDGEKTADIKKLLVGIARRYLKDDMIDGDAKFKTVDYDNPYFESAIINYEDVPNERSKSNSLDAIYDARKEFEGRLKEASIECILKWVAKLENASITTYVVKGKVEAAQIFAFQNDRGKGLTDLEVIKAYLMMQLFKSKNSERIIGDIETMFKDIYRAIARVPLHENTVLRYYWQAIGPRGYNSENVVGEVKDYIKKDGTADKIKKFVADLSKAFCLVEEIEADSSFDVANLKRLDNMRISYPLLIRARVFGVSAETERRLVKLMENLTFRYLLRGGRAGITGRLQNVINDKGANNDESFNALIDTIKWKINGPDWYWYWCDGEMIRYISGWFYNNSMDDYLLWRYEQYLCQKEKGDYSTSITNENVEHIAPQTPPKNLSESGYNDIYVYNEEEKRIETDGYWINCVGNLMLLDEPTNIFLSNRPFKEKLETYKKLPLYQQRKVEDFATGNDTEHPVWDKAAIERRRDAIVEAAKEIWDLGKI